MRLIQRWGRTRVISPTSAPKMPIDVADGDAAVGMSIDFYGRFQAESARDPRTGQERMHYFNPPGGTSIGVDPIGLLRGAPHRELALAFMEYVMSVEGQKLWDFKVGAPGGPQKYALRRSADPARTLRAGVRRVPCRPGRVSLRGGEGFYVSSRVDGGAVRPVAFHRARDVHRPARGGARGVAELIRAKFPPEATRTFRGRGRRVLRAGRRPHREALKSPDKLDEPGWPPR